MLKEVCRHYADVVGLAVPTPATQIPLADARGLVLSEDVAARFAIPPFTNSAMDGFAVRAADVAPGVPLQIEADIAAGSHSELPLTPGSAQRIMTGAPLPDGADAILQVELTEDAANNMLPAAPESVTPTATLAAGTHVRPAGEDIAVGSPAFAAGTRLTPAHLAALAAIGYAEAPVHTRPNVGIIATGDELRAPGEALAAGQIPDSNSVLLRHLVAESGATPVPFTCHSDTVETFLAGIREVVDGVDMIVTSGGVSAGAFDVVKAALRTLGVEFTKVAMQPGKPQGFGLLRDSAGRAVPIICLPGNPVSVFVSWQLFGRPLLGAIFGEPAGSYESLFRTARVGTGWSRKPGRTQFLPCIFTDDGVVAPATSGGSKSHLIAALPLATGLARVPADVAQVRPGDLVDVLVL
ncbi:gephyrin-like molybdotransferase Glp [Ancrocorticia populi]|uniref:molybdopterin molybdotransferase MoeA n=1 Tax=Ancrocorticia populi TaxID=2175228 RepID=UPI002355EF97|nr:gephyrin-like molybdotransferase Glp [Ancrocorticia populi]